MGVCLFCPTPIHLPCCLEGNCEDWCSNSNLGPWGDIEDGSHIQRWVEQKEGAWVPVDSADLLYQSWIACFWAYFLPDNNFLYV